MKAFTSIDDSQLLPEPLTKKQANEVPGVLGKIVRERCRDYEGALINACELVSKRGRFSSALEAKGLSIIAEVKRASPSQGSIAELDPLEAALAYQKGGAKALSILTEPRHFGGHLRHLEQVAKQVELPLLRKDFTVHPKQMIEAQQVGASAVLLIVAVLAEQTESYIAFSQALGLDALVEVHNDEELEIAMAAKAEIIGVNNRNLQTLNIDLATAPRLIEKARGAGFKGLLVAESGYKNAEDLRPLREVADAALVGTSLAGSSDLEKAVSELNQVLNLG